MTGFDFSITYLSRCLDVLRRTPCESVCRLKRILVVDDERSITFALQQYFAFAGFCVDCAWSGEEAQRYLAANQYDVAIVDVELRDEGGVLDGIDLALFIRNSAPLTAVIVLTAVSSADTRRRAEAAGVRSYLSKPARLSHVADIAIGLIERSAPRRAITAAAIAFGQITLPRASNFPTTDRFRLNLRKWTTFRGPGQSRFYR